MKTYTKSKMILTGIIDHPDNLRAMSNLFFKTLVYTIKFHAPQPFPEKWKEMASHYMESDILKRFPREWYEFLKGGTRESLVRDTVVSLASACFAIVDIYGLGGMDAAMAGPRHILEVFQGNVPKSLESGWLDHDPVLKPLVIKAYRNAFKMLLDQVSIGDLESDEEFKVRRRFC